jgi:serine protease AprX
MKKLIAVSLIAIILGWSINTNASASANTLSNNNENSAINKTIINNVLLHPEKELHIIIGTKGDTDIVEKAVKKQGGRITATWSFIHSFSVTIQASAVLKIASMPEVKYLYEDEVSHVTAETEGSSSPATLKNTYDSSVNADNAWTKGFDGSGVTVAVVDTGVNSGTDFSGRLTEQILVDSNSSNVNDGYGHGTHIAGIIAGDGLGSNGAYIGVAPKANIISVKVSDDAGVSSEIDMVNGLQWVFDHHEEYKIKVVNISSQVATQQSYKNSALDAAVEQLWKAGVVVVVSAGNKGASSDSNDTISYAPANDPFAITVGSIDENGQTALSDFTYPSFSSYGTTVDGFSKPDLMAPGIHIVSYMPSGVLKTSYPSAVVNDNYFMMSGTSMSAPIVSGAVALLLQAYPNLTPDQVKYVLKSTTKEYGQNNGTMPEGTPGVLQADLAIDYVGSKLNSGSVIPSDNQGVSLSPNISADGDTVTYNNMTWSNMTWSNMTWSSIMNYQK